MKPMKNKPFSFMENGRVYFSKQTERKVFFILTLAMLAWGVLSKWGWL
jgi:hypothetical protein